VPADTVFRRHILCVKPRPTIFSVCKSVHHHTFKLINQPDASTIHIYCSSFKYSSTCFEHPPSPIIRSLSTAVAASGLPLERGGSSATGRGRNFRKRQNILVLQGIETRFLDSIMFASPSPLSQRVTPVIVGWLE